MTYSYRGSLHTVHRNRGNSPPFLHISNLTTDTTKNCPSEAALAALWPLLRVHLYCWRCESWYWNKKKFQDGSSWRSCLPKWESTKDLLQWGCSCFISKNKVSQLKTPASPPNHNCLGTEHPAACLGLHGHFSGLCSNASTAYLRHGGLQMFPDSSDSPTNNIFPHSDLDLHPVTVHNEGESHKNHLKFLT